MCYHENVLLLFLPLHFSSTSNFDNKIRFLNSSINIVLDTVLSAVHALYPLYSLVQVEITSMEKLPIYKFPCTCFI